jgi:hypothetical protein
VRVQLGDFPSTTAEDAPEAGWTRVTGPASTAAHLLTWLLGILLFFLLITPVILQPLLAIPAADPGAAGTPETPWLAIILTLPLSVLAHELAHAAFLPGFGLSSSTVFVVWPRKLRFAIFFEGRLSRSRWMAMRSAPIVLLGVLPVLWLILTAGQPRSFTLETCMSVLILVNSLGSGADLLAIYWVGTHIPAGSTLKFRAGKAYWRAKSQG